MPYTTTKPPFWVTKRHLREVNHDLQQQLAHAQRDVLSLRGDLAKKDEEARQWRAAYEAMTTNPEVKADTEAAYKRGDAMARQKIARYLMGVAREVSETITVAADNVENPYRQPVEPWPTS